MRWTGDAVKLRSALRVTGLLVATGACLAACSSSKSGSGATTSTTASAGGNSTTTTAGSSGSGTTSSTAASNTPSLGSLTGEVAAAQHLTFSASYAEVGSTSQSMTLTYAQMPPKSLFKASGADLINTGSGTYSCSASSGTTVCISFGTTNPFASTLNFVTGETVLTGLNALKSGIAQKLPNFSASYSTASYAGQSAECVSGTESTNTFKYCLTSSGVLAYAGGSNNKTFGSLTMTSYSTSVSSSEFSLPAGATVETIPSTP